jgi:pimeloyl-ACP methyl ester carboxylesterase
MQVPRRSDKRRLTSGDKTMPYTNNQGVKIHYEVTGKGEPLLLVHGMFVNWKTWRDYGFVEAMKNEYRLIMVDVRGHGRSDKPHDPKLYEEKILASDLATVLDDLNVDKAHYLGYSMGGWIGFAAAKYAPDRFHSFIIGGWQPYSDMPGHGANPIPTLREHGNEGIVAWLGTAATLSDEEKTDLLANDVEAIIALAQNGRSDFSDILPSMSMPCLLYCGDADDRHAGAQACVKEMPNATFVSLPGRDHLGVIYRGSDEILSHITKFLARTRK